MSEIIDTTAATGAHIVNGPLTTGLTETASPGLLRSEIDQRVLKVRPFATPLDQISRMAGTRKALAMKVKYYSVGVKPSSTSITASNYHDDAYTLTVKDSGVLSATDTFMVLDITGVDGGLVAGYVIEADGTSLKAVVSNYDSANVIKLQGHEIVRMGRAATELDVQTPSYEALPKPDDNLCQIFKAQIEQSTVQRLTNKEVGWTLNDQEEVALTDMRLGMERSFLFGIKGTVTDTAKNEEVTLTGGIWSQAGNEMYYDSSDVPADFVHQLTREAFTGHDSSRHKVLICGSNLIDKLNRLDVQRTAGVNDTVSKWGLDFTEIVTKFGRLSVIHSEIFDACGMPGNGMVIDPDYLTKYSFIPMQAERLDLKKSGQRNTEAVVITEASCLVLRYPDAHMRVIAL